MHIAKICDKVSRLSYAERISLYFLYDMLIHSVLEYVSIVRNPREAKQGHLKGDMWRHLSPPFEFGPKM